jgi:hypothetical protein
VNIWLEFLKTPMAAPETSGLRTHRMVVLSLAVALALSIVFLKPMRIVLGAGAGGAVAGLLLALIVLVPVYVIRKNRADESYLDDLIRDRDESGSAVNAPTVAG